MKMWDGKILRTFFFLRYQLVVGQVGQVGSKTSFAVDNNVNNRL